MPKNFIEDFAKTLSNSLPEGIKQTKAEMEIHFKELLAQSLTKLNMVSREEFEISYKVLLKSRAKIETLEARVSLLESQLQTLMDIKNQPES